MKKFFALIAVLAMTVSANAGLTYVLDADDYLGASVVDYANAYDDDLGVTEHGYLASAQLKYFTPPQDSAPGVLEFTPIYYNGSAISLLGADDGAEYLVVSMVVDLTNFDSVESVVYNVNDDNWEYVLFVDSNNDGTIDVSDASGILNPWSTAPFMDVLTIDASNLSGATTVNLAIINRHSAGDADTPFVSVAVPAPGAVLLSGLGTVLVGLVRRRSL